jgi:hypothetical protein
MLKPALSNRNFYAKSIEVNFSLQHKKIKIIFIKHKNNNGVYKIKAVSLNLLKIAPLGEDFIIRKRDLKKDSIIRVYLG